jgi:YesN/AraC family two-component response regulator
MAKIDPRVSQAIEFMERNLDRNLSLGKVAHLARLSKGYFGELFKQETGKIFRAYLKKIRIEKACRLLAGTGLEIKEVSRSVGYRDIQSFYHDFKKMTGMTPLEYRHTGGSAG